MTIDELLSRLRSMGDEGNVAGMARYGIVPKLAYGVSTPDLKQIAMEVKRTAEDRHQFALALWETGVHDARVLAYLIDDPRQVTPEQMERWVQGFDNWAICDSTCGHLFALTRHAYEKYREWIARDEEFVKRAGIALMAWLALKDKKADDEPFTEMLGSLEQLTNDGRPYIKKAISWSIRQIGKRNLQLNRQAIETADRIKEQDTSASRWIASDSLRELKSEAVQHRIRVKG
jgi:3-methyladenine DNA glycosylase AlkD